MGKMKELSTVLDEIVACGGNLVQAAEKLKDMAAVIEALAECGNTLISSGGALRDFFAETAEPTKAAPTIEKSDKPKPAAEPEKKYAKEDVRVVLASASQNGHRSEVIALLKKYGAGNITSLDPKDYAAVIAEAERWKNG